jgi:SAM-dependent methyltransferase
MTPAVPRSEQLRRFRSAYAEQRASEGRGAGGVRELLELPYLQTGPNVRSWQVRARTFDAFVRRIIAPARRRLRVLDLGAGNGWLCYRMKLLGHDAVAIDMRADDVDGLGAAEGYRAHLNDMFARTAASFDALPLAAGTFDVVVFNASLHYAFDLDRALAEAVRVLAPGGRIAILDSPFYRHDHSGQAMVAEKRRSATRQFGDRAADLLALPFVEYLTQERLDSASQTLNVNWRRHRVRYPLWYEVRSLRARLTGARSPSRFDVWEGSLS